MWVLRLMIFQDEIYTIQQQNEKQVGTMYWELSHVKYKRVSFFLICLAYAVGVKTFICNEIIVIVDGRFEVVFKA